MIVSFNCATETQWPEKRLLGLAVLHYIALLCHADVSRFVNTCTSFAPSVVSLPSRPP